VLQLNKVRHVVLDMDGTFYLGNRVFPESQPFLASLARLGIGHSFMTNNCSRSRHEYVLHLGSIGIDADIASIQTSAQATAFHIQSQLPHVNRLFVLGTDGLDDDFRQAGFEIVDRDPEAVVVGFDMQLTYDDLCQTAYWISRGLPYIATHPDRICPTDRPIVLPDCAAICALLETATGRLPDAIPGKPNPAMLQAVCATHGVAANEVMMVGDRLYTDIRMGRDAGAIAVLTLTGEAKKADLDSCPAETQPDLVVEHLGELQQMLERARQ
jgi:HAD superfamily hydrolase (TIGR01450 family)